MTRLLVPALATLLAIAASAQAQFDLGSASPRSERSMSVDVLSVAPGDTFTVALKLEHPPEWHSYYLNSGGIELPLEIQWSLPDGFTAGPIQWPTPEVKDGYFGKSFIYSGSPVFLIDITAPANLQPGGSVEFKGVANWQICKQSCINEQESFLFNIKTSEETTADGAMEDFFSHARSQIPTTPAAWSFTADEDGESLVIRIEADAPIKTAPTDFVPDQPFVKSVSSGGTISHDGKTIVITVPRATKDALDNEIPQGDAISGILLGPDIKVPLTTIGAAAATAEDSAAPLAGTTTVHAGLLTILAGMFVGGLILNLMPCVFPVIGLKIMGFVQQAGEDRRKIVLHGLTFTAGVLASFAVLSTILLIFKKGWGYQLENPWVVLSLMILMFVLALNMFGVFEIGTSATSIGGSLQSKQGLGGSFFSGVLATIVATPCSAPFLGAAIGAAIGLPPVLFFTAFGAMALGLSTPYLVLSAFPRLIDLLPRPGAWMESFKQGMSFLLFATTGYLLWVYAGQIDLENLLGPVFGLSCIAIAAWIHGRWNLPHRKQSTRITAVVLAIAFAATGIFLAKPPKPSALEWQTWSPEKVEQLLQDGTPVYIDFTAKWCATCQVNKKRAYTPEVIAAMHDKGVVALKADKTKPNPDIDKAIQELGRAAIPVNVLLAPGKEPVILPELLSPDDVLEALEGL